MAPVFDTKILEILNSLPVKTLRTFARRNGVQIADDESAADIITDLSKSCPGAVHDKIRAAFIIDVEVVEHDLKDDLKQVIETQVALGMRGIDLLKWVGGFVVGLLGLLVTLGGVVTGFKLFDLDKELKIRSAELTELQKRATSIVSEQQAYAKAYGSYITWKIVKIVDDVLVNFSLTLPDSQLVDELNACLSTLDSFESGRDLTSANGGKSSTEDDEMMALSKELVTAVLDYESLKVVTEPNEKLRRIHALTTSWTSLTIPEGLRACAESHLKAFFRSGQSL